MIAVCAAGASLAGQTFRSTMTELLKFSPTVGFRPPDSFPCRPRQTKINAVFHCYQSQKLRPWEPTDNPSSAVASS